MTPQICLGTAQFGLAYGITNAGGQVLEASVGNLLAQAAASEISWLDTAQAYGNAESVLGRQLPKSHSFRLISKFSAQPQPEFLPQDVKAWEQSFFKSCQSLGVQDLDAFLLHEPADLLKPGGHLLEAWMLSLRERGVVKRIGLSIYSAEDLDGVNPLLLDLVQLPLSLYDQRLLQNGTLAHLRSRGTAIHARSLYLQGLLLTPAAKWPLWVSAEARFHQQCLEALAEQRGCQLIDLVLGFAREQSDLEALVIGLCSVQELNALLNIWQKTSPWLKGEWSTWALKDPSILDPRCWPR
ncbi:hypothetical protein KR100_01325 [Synechococcus sp. KORDI-100]|uniref:aldo/keto reductase n=1 Tax=Synechococcus sp. KORDI-100 TaxID=1280380 RepID=UPI0004E07BCC|nr:aldo/keto reductase [Synechococcus sp. KORDI-100]AII42047.1 hypothetical protein KR100_01325 [Synechococcus sp. KORDI-100]